MMNADGTEELDVEQGSADLKKFSHECEAREQVSVQSTTFEESRSSSLDESDDAELERKAVAFAAVLERTIHRRNSDMHQLQQNTPETDSLVSFCCQWRNWSRERIRRNMLGVLSSSLVLTVRLLLDREPSAYIIHSIVVYFDMLLIHLLTNSPWLSISGEILTIISFLLFFFTKQTLFELTETTGLAILCSFHLIKSRNKHKDHAEELEREVQTLVRRNSFLVRRSFSRSYDESKDNLSESLGYDAHELKSDNLSVNMQQLEASEGSVSHETLRKQVRNWFVAPTQKAKNRVHSCGGKFVEHFLDGSAGVMYTSFLGLIIDEIINYEQKR